MVFVFFFFSSRRRHTRYWRDWSSDVCSSDLILRYAFDLAMTRPRKKVTSATKSNGITFTMPYWDERFAAMAKGYPQVTTDQFHIDILCAHFVQHPDWFDVVVGSNLFGDILSDLGPAVAGSIGIAASANINPEKRFPSMFEPVHGSAPDIAGKWICNPIGQIWSGAMMLEHLGERQAAEAIVAAIEALDRKSTRLNSSHANISYAVFCLKKKKHNTYSALIK